MGSKRVELADAIVALLNNEENEFVLSFTATRKAAPITEVELAEANEVIVSVFTGARKTERVTRGRYSKSYQPVIAVQRPLKDATPEAMLTTVDKLEELVEQIEDLIDGEDLADLSFESLDDEQYSEVYNAEAMQNLSFFAAAIVPEYTSG